MTVEPKRCPKCDGLMVMRHTVGPRSSRKQWLCIDRDCYDPLHWLRSKSKA